MLWRMLREKREDAIKAWWQLSSSPDADTHMRAHTHAHTRKGARMRSREVLYNWSALERSRGVLYNWSQGAEFKGL